MKPEEEDSKITNIDIDFEVKEEDKKIISIKGELPLYLKDYQSDK